MNAARQGWRAALAMAALLGAARAQVDAFDARVAGLEAARRDGADAAVLRPLAAAALDAFLRTAPDAAGRDARLARAAAVALEAGDAGRALDFARGAEARGDAVTAVLLVALQRAEGADAALDAAHGRRRDPAVADYLLAARGIDRGALFEAALRRLRDGEVELAVWTFETTAARLEALAATHPDPRVAIEAGIERGNAALLQRLLGDHARATAGYDAAVALAPDDEILWSDRGLARKAAGDLDAAVASLTRSVAVEPAPGVGPGTTNLAVLAATPRSAARADVRAALRSVATRAGVDPAADPLAAGLGVVLAERPEQALVRRLEIDRILAGHRGRSGEFTRGSDSSAADR